MGLRLRRTPVIVTKVVLGAAVLLAVSAPALAGVVTNRIAHATATPDISKIRFLSPVRYVREDSAGDLVAQLITYNATTEVEFYVDGDMNKPIAGSDHGAHGKTYHQWRLITALDAGKHTITARVSIGGQWYDVQGHMTTFSLDMPGVEYVFPNTHRDAFRQSDSPLKVKIDDEFSQFKAAAFSLYRYDAAKKKPSDHIGDFRLERDQCDTSKAGQYVICDVTAANNWTQLSGEAGENAYIAKLATRTLANNGVRPGMNEYWAQFVVDNEKPVAGDLQIHSAAIVKDTLAVSATATDNNQVQSVSFYVTAPGENGVCSGEGEKLVQKTVTDTSDGRYHAFLDVSELSVHGQATAPYCVSVVSEDDATNTSDAMNAAFSIDHIAPVVTLKVTSSTTPSASTPVTITGTVDGKATLALFKDGAKVVDFDLAMSGLGQWSYRFDGGLDKGDHVLKVVATDSVGNSSNEATSPRSFASLNVSAYIPPKETSTLSTAITPPQLPQNVVVPAASVAQIIASHQSAVQKNSDQAVLGVETSKDTDTSSGAVISPSTGGWVFFGIAWYWWLLLMSAIGGAIGWLAAGVRSRQAA